MSRRTPVYDHGDQLLYYADRTKVDELLLRKDVGVIGTTKRIDGLRMQGPDLASALSGGSRARRGLGSSHTRDSYYNTDGTWTLDRIPAYMRPDFERVVRSIAA